MFELEGSRLEPDLVLLAFYVGNDFRDDVGDNALVAPELDLGDRLARLSLTYRAVRALHRLRGLEPEALGAAGEAVVAEPLPAGGYELLSYRREYDAARPTVAADFYARVVARRMEVCLAARSGRFAEELERVARTLEGLAAAVEAAGAHFVVALLPDEFQIDAALRRAAFAHAGTSAEEYDLALPQRALGERLAAAGIETVDLLPAFERASRRLYRPRDTHWNPAGCRLAAAALAKALAASPATPPGVAREPVRPSSPR
jgi:hypothetical protein